MADALCAQTDPELFFPEKGGSTRAGKAMCQACRVRAECLDYALANNEKYGTWGGLTERERRPLTRRTRRNPLRAVPDPAPDNSAGADDTANTGTTDTSTDNTGTDRPEQGGLTA